MLLLFDAGTSLRSSFSIGSCTFFLQHRIVPRVRAHFFFLEPPCARAWDSFFFSQSLHLAWCFRFSKGIFPTTPFARAPVPTLMLSTVPSRTLFSISSATSPNQYRACRRDERVGWAYQTALPLPSEEAVAVSRAAAAFTSRSDGSSSNNVVGICDLIRRRTATTLGSSRCNGHSNCTLLLAFEDPLDPPFNIFNADGTGKV